MVSAPETGLSCSVEERQFALEATLPRGGGGEPTEREHLRVDSCTSAGPEGDGQIVQDTDATRCQEAASLGTCDRT